MKAWFAVVHEIFSSHSECVGVFTDKDLADKWLAEEESRRPASENMGIFDIMLDLIEADTSEFLGHGKKEWTKFLVVSQVPSVAQFRLYPAGWTETQEFEANKVPPLQYGKTENPIK